MRLLLSQNCPQYCYTDQVHYSQDRVSGSDLLNVPGNAVLCAQQRRAALHVHLRSAR